MKVFFLVVVSALASFLANAATGVSWTLLPVCDGSAGVYLSEGCAAYLIDVSKLTQQDVLDAIYGGASLSDAIGNKYVISSSLDATGAVVDKVGAENVYAGGSKVSFFAVVANTSKSELYFTAATAEKTISGTGNTPLSIMSTGSDSPVKEQGTTFAVGGAGWYSTASVPEPTSGLLLLLGFSALALRRKRA